MVKKQIMKISKEGSQIVWIDSLEELKGYKLDRIQRHEALGHHTTSPGDNIFLKKGDETYRIDSQSFKHLKYNYQSSRHKDKKIDELIEDVNKELKSNS